MKHPHVPRRFLNIHKSEMNVNGLFLPGAHSLINEKNYFQLRHSFFSAMIVL